MASQLASDEHRFCCNDVLAGCPKRIRAVSMLSHPFPAQVPNHRYFTSSDCLTVGTFPGHDSVVAASMFQCLKFQYGLELIVSPTQCLPAGQTRFQLASPFRRLRKWSSALSAKIELSNVLVKMNSEAGIRCELRACVFRGQCVHLLIFAYKPGLWPCGL